MKQLNFRARFVALTGGALVLGAVALAGAAPATAQANDGEMACQGDAFRFCEQLIPDRGKVAACLRKNRLRLSPDCRRMFAGGSRKSLRRR